MTATVPARFQIRRLVLDCTVPAAAPGRAGLGGRLERLLRERLPGALAQALGPLADGDGVLLLRRLDLSLDLDLSLGDGVIATRWAAALRAAVLAALAGRDTATDGLAWFPDRTQQLARFAVDLAAGRAWQGWLYRPFEGLKALPVSAALRTALADPHADGAGALLAMAPTDWPAVLCALSAGDARRLLVALAGAADGPPGACPEAALDALVQALAPGTQERLLAETEPARGALALWLTGLRAAPGAGVPLAPLARAAARLAAELTRADTAGLSARIAAGDWSGIAGARGAELTLALRPLAGQGPGARLREAVTTPVSRTPAGAEPRWTAFGNALLLLPIIAELPFRALAVALTGADPPVASEPASAPEALLRWAVLARCQGLGSERACLRDPLVAALCGIAPRTSTADLAAWLDGLRPAALAAARGVLVGWIDPAPERLALVAVDPGAGETKTAPGGAPGIDAVLIETDRGSWLALLGPGGDSTPPPVGGRPASAPPSPVVTADLAFLLGGLDRPVDRFLAQLAQVVLKRFCYRLPGFADASAGHLHRNFLGMDARLTWHDGAIEARLGEVPLALVLAMTGADRRTLSLPWYSGLPIRLHREAGR